MNNEQEIERMAMLLVNDIICGHNAEETAAHLAKYSIGDKKQAVKEFAEKLKNRFYNMDYSAIAIDNKIDDLITEIYGADE